MTAPYAQEIGEYRLMGNYTQIDNELLTQIMITKFAAIQNQVFICVMRKTIGWGKDFDRIALSQISKDTGVQPSHISRALKELRERKIVLKIDSELGINFEFSEWILTTKNTGNKNLKKGKVTENGNGEALTENGNKKLPRTDSKVTENGNKKLPRTVDTKETKTTTKKTIKESNVELVFSFWKNILNHPRAKLDAKRKALIQKSIKIGFTVDELKTAISGCSKTPFNMGKNDRNQIYDGLHVIFKDADQIERFIVNSESGIKANPSAPADWIDEVDPFACGLEEGFNNA